MSIPETTKAEVFNPTSLTFFEALYRISDPRKKRGSRHNFHAILKLVILGFCSRLVWLEHIVEFASHNWDEIKGYKDTKVYRKHRRH
jgi:hypothetical protein